MGKCFQPGGAREYWIMNQTIGTTIITALLTVGCLAGVRAAVDPAQAQADKAALVKGNTEFAVDLYGKLRDKPGNLFLSPYSISTALGMTAIGARGQTLAQMDKTLHFPVEQARLHPAFAALNAQLNSGKKGYQLV